MTQARISAILRDHADNLDVGEPEVHDAAYWLEWMLQNWARYMHGDEYPEGLPVEASGGATGFTHQGDSESAYIKLDIGLAEATNAAIDGLDVSEQVAIYAAYGVAAVWRFNRQTDILSRAKQHVMESLKRRGVWLGD